MSANYTLKYLLSLILVTIAVQTNAELVYTFDDMRFVDNSQAKDTFMTERYWELNRRDRWGTVWESQWGLSDTFPSTTTYNHFHIGFKGLAECLDFESGGMGRYVRGECTALETDVNRGPFSQHDTRHQLHFQVVQQNGTLVPFYLKSMDIYGGSDQFVDVYARTESGAWVWWRRLFGRGEDSSNSTFKRWGFPNTDRKVVDVVWKRSSDGGVGTASVGRISVQD